MHPTAIDAASHLSKVSAAVARAVAEPSALETLPLTLATLHKDFAASFMLSRLGDSIVAKAADQQIAYGWASVSTLNGELVTDLQGDQILIGEMQTAVHEFMKDRAGDAMHNEDQCAEIVDSLVVTKALADAMGWDAGREGWFVGFKVHDANVWKRFLSGELKAFSIAGEATVTEVDE